MVREQLQFMRRFSRGLVIVICFLAPMQTIGEDRSAGTVSTSTVAQLSEALSDGRLTSEQLVSLLLARIQAYEPNLHAILSINPNALEQARALDAERRAHGARSSLHGIPVLLKDNINTTDLPTTLGFYGLKGALATSEAAVVTKLKAAGAIILAKTNMSELSSGPPMSSLGGQTHNPHNLQYSPAGSSNGSAVGVAAGYAPIGIGTDTTGSVRWPAAVSGIVGLRPTTGIVDSAGVQSSSPTLDVVGPMARSVLDVAVVLEVMSGRSLVASLRTDALRGKRIGFARQEFSSGNAEIDRAMNEALDTLRASGATVVDIELPRSLVQLVADLQSVIVRTEAVPSLNGYLQASFQQGVPRSHAEILKMSEGLLRSAPPGATPNPGRLDGYKWEASALPLTDAYYIAARDQGRAWLRACLQFALEHEKLDAIVYPSQTLPINKIGEYAPRDSRGRFGNFGFSIASLAGWPDITVPAGLSASGLPVGVSFMTSAFGEERLLNIAVSFEHATDAIRQPSTTPPLAGESIE